MNINVIVRVTGLIARTIMPAPRRALIDDASHRPFPDSIGNRPTEPVATTNVMMSKWQAPPSFFSQCRKTYDSDHRGIQARLDDTVKGVEAYIYLVNVWLTIVNYFGLEVRYRKEFVEQMKEIAVWIPIFAYRRNGYVPDNKLCRFHNQDYTLQEMTAMFDAFFKSYDVM